MHFDVQKLEPGQERLSPEILIWDENPRSVVSLMGDHGHKLTAAKAERPDLFEFYDEQSLYKAMRGEGLLPTATDNRLRLRFWLEYDFAQTYGLGKIDVARVAAGICDVQTFTRRYLLDPRKVAWLLCPPTGYMAKANEALEFGLEQLRDILEQPHIVNGKVDARLADIKLKVVALLEMRVLGAVATKNLNVNYNHPMNAHDVAKRGQQDTMETLEAQLKVMREENERLANGGLPPGQPITEVAAELNELAPEGNDPAEEALEGECRRLD